MENIIKLTLFKEKEHSEYLIDNLYCCLIFYSLPSQ